MRIISFRALSERYFQDCSFIKATSDIASEVALLIVEFRYKISGVTMRARLLCYHLCVTLACGGSLLLFRYKISRVTVRKTLSYFISNDANWLGRLAPGGSPPSPFKSYKKKRDTIRMVSLFWRKERDLFSPAGSVRLGSDSPPDCHSLPRHSNPINIKEISFRISLFWRKERDLNPR